MEGTRKQSDNRVDLLRMGDPMLVAAAHELKAPLALIRQLSLGIEEGTMRPTEVAEWAERITLTAERALRLTTDLTKASRLEDSLFTLEPVNPMTICEEVAAELTPLYKAKGKELYIRSRTRTPLAIANHDLLRRVLANFIDNALHYSEASSPVEISVRAHSRGERVRLCVRDRGPSLPANLWKTLSHSLGLGPQSIHMRPASSGLGIHLSSQFADVMQARIGAVRHADGASFYVDLAASTQMRLL